MSDGRRRSTTGRDEWDTHLDSLLDDIAPTSERALLRDILIEAVRLADTDVERLDLKIVRAALREMREAFVAFAPVRDRRKVTVFGSARTTESDPLYTQARQLARSFADDGWMVVTGAGPGIMLAAMEGAGRAASFGVRIRLPFETDANDVIVGDTKLVSMKYFFTRKLMLMKESAAFVAMPGGFGTLDEMMELITLQQTGKAIPTPVVLLDVPGGTFWKAWRRFITDQVAGGAYADPEDLAMVRVCDDHTEAVAHVAHFYANYRSIRWVGNELIIRLNHAPDTAQLRDLNDRFADLATDGRGIRVTNAFAVERTDQDDPSAARVRLHMDPARTAGLHRLIDALNDLVEPAQPSSPASSQSSST